MSTNFDFDTDGALMRTNTPSQEMYLVRDSSGVFVVREGTPLAGSSSEKMWIDPENGTFLYWDHGKWEQVRVSSLPVGHLTAGTAEMDTAAIKQMVTSKGFIDQLFAGQATIGSDEGVVVIKDGTVDASKIRVTQEMWGKLAVFAKVTTDMLVAGGATITGEILADTIRLGTNIVAGDPNGDATVLDPQGLHVYQGGNEVIRIGQNVKNGLQVWNDNMGRMVNLSESAFGGWSYYSSARFAMNPPSKASDFGSAVWGSWRRVELGTFTPPTSRVTVSTGFKASSTTMQQHYGGRGLFILRPDSASSAGGQIVMTDSGGSYFTGVLDRAHVEVARSEVTPGTTYYVVFLGRVFLKFSGNKAYPPTLSDLTCLLDPA